MNKDIIQAKFHGFQLAIDIAKQLVADRKPIELNSAIGMARQMADGEETTVDPENAGSCFDSTTQRICKDTAMMALDAQRRHAANVCEGLVSIVNDSLKNE